MGRCPERRWLRCSPGRRPKKAHHVPDKIKDIKQKDSVDTLAKRLAEVTLPQSPQVRADTDTECRSVVVAKQWSSHGRALNG